MFNNYCYKQYALGWEWEEHKAAKDWRWNRETIYKNITSLVTVCVGGWHETCNQDTSWNNYARLSSQMKLYLWFTPHDLHVKKQNKKLCYSHIWFKLATLNIQTFHPDALLIESERKRR